MDASRIKENNKCKISLHVIINKCGVFVNRDILKNFVKSFKNTLTNDFIYNNINFIDDKVYNTPQLFKLVYSPCKDNNTLLKPFFINNGLIENVNELDVSKNFTDFLVGNYTKQEKILDNNFLQLKDVNIKEKIKKDIKELNVKTNVLTEIPKWKINWIKNNNLIKNIYNIRNIKNNKVNLDRINPSDCSLCKRTHNNENGFCIIDENNIIFYCGRNNKGKVIGSWYNKNNNIKKEKEIPVSCEEVSSLKEINAALLTQNKILREELIKIKEVKGIKKNIKENNISTDMWNKYYVLGTMFINGGWENIIGSWGEKNVSKLKNRCLRIKEYIDVINTKGINNTFSLRKIFHLKNYQFTELISSL